MRMYKWMAVILAAILLLSLTGCKREDVVAGNSDTSASLQDKEMTEETEYQRPVDDGLYTVTFYSNNGTILKMENVEPHASATPPMEPQMAYGTVFLAWDNSFTDVTKDLEVRPLCVKFTGMANVFAVSSTYGRVGETVVVPIRLCGDVCVSGFDITVTYDAEKLTLRSVTEDGSVVYNDETPGVIRLNYVTAENTTADVDVCFLQFEVVDVFESASVSVTVNGICAFNNSIESQDDSMYIPSANVIDGNVFVIQ